MDDIYFCEQTALEKFTSRAAAVKQPSRPYRVSQSAAPAPSGPVAVVQVNGVLLKRDGWLAQALGSSTYDGIQRQLELAEQSSSVKSVVLHVDSPGGQASGCSDVAKFIHSMSKPVTAIVDGLCCSAAYFLASQCNQIIASSDSMIGSIGCVLQLPDVSRQLAAQGIVVNVITKTPMKTAGSPTKQMTDEERTYLTGLCGDMADIFVSAVKSGRPRVSQDAFSGEVWIASKAKSLGLIDSIQPARETLAAIESKYAGAPMTMKLPSVDIPVKASTLQKSKVSVQRLQWQRRWNEEREQREKLIHDDEAEAESQRARMKAKRERLLGWNK